VKRKVGQFGDDLVAASSEPGRSGLVKFWRDRRLAGNDVFDDDPRRRASKRPFRAHSVPGHGYQTTAPVTRVRDPAALPFEPMIGDKMRVFKIRITRS
jgi:hypothetical protein